MKLTLLPTCLQCHLPELFLEVVFICWYHFITDMIVYTYAEFGRNCLKKTNEILRIVQSVALGVCFSIYYDWTITDQIEFWKIIFRVLYYWSYLKFTLFHRQPRDWFRISNNRVIDFVYQNYTLMNTDEHWRHMFCANVSLPTKSWNVQPRKWWDKKCTGYVGGFIFQTGDLYS